jgi:sugar phosphate isomerase/epimerase
MDRSDHRDNGLPCHHDRLTRRDALKVFGAGVAALSLPARAADNAKPSSGSQRLNPVPAGSAALSTMPAGPAGRLKLGIFTSVYAGLPLDEAARRIRDDGFAGVVLEYGFKDVRFDPAKPDWAALDRITKTLDRNGLQVAGLYGYYNVIDPNPAGRKAGEARMDLLIKNWKRFGSPIISTETGTFNAQNQFGEDPRNDTEEGYVACRSAFEKLARAAEKTGAIIAIEAYWRNVINSAERNERLFREVNSPSLKLTMDPCNYFRDADLPRMKPMLQDIFKRVGSSTVLAHAKDVKAAPNGPDLPAAGLGQLDYPEYLRLLSGLHKDLFLVIEHLTLPDVPRARDYVKAQMAKA